VVYRHHQELAISEYRADGHLELTVDEVDEAAAHCVDRLPHRHCRADVLFIDGDSVHVIARRTGLARRCGSKGRAASKGVSAVRMSVTIWPVDGASISPNML
jgi:hypothetical protein